MNIQEELLRLLEENGPMTRDDFCEAFGFEKYRIQDTTNYMKGQTLIHYHRDFEQYHSRTTVYDNLKKLLEQGKIEKFPKKNGKVGRTPIFWRLKS